MKFTVSSYKMKIFKHGYVSFCHETLQFMRNSDRKTRLGSLGWLETPSPATSDLGIERHRDAIDSLLALALGNNEDDLCKHE